MKKVYKVTKPMHNPPHVGKMLRMIIEDLEMTVTRAAELLQVDRKTLSRLLSEKADLSVEMALRVSAVFGCNAEHLLAMQIKHNIEKHRK